MLKVFGELYPQTPLEVCLYNKLILGFFLKKKKESKQITCIQSLISAWRGVDLVGAHLYLFGHFEQKNFNIADNMKDQLSYLQ